MTAVSTEHKVYSKPLILNSIQPDRKKGKCRTHILWWWVNEVKGEDTCDVQPQQLQYHAGKVTPGTHNTGEVTYLTATVVALHWQGYTWNTQPLTGEVTYLTATVVALHWQGYTWNTQPFTGEVPSNIQPQQPQLCIGKTTLEMHTTIHRWSNQWYPNPTTATTHWQGYTWNTQLFRV